MREATREEIDEIKNLIEKYYEIKIEKIMAGCDTKRFKLLAKGERIK